MVVSFVFLSDTDKDKTMPPNVGIVTFIVLMYQSWCLWNGSLALWPNWIRHQTSDLGIAGSSPVVVGRSFSPFTFPSTPTQNVLLQVRLELTTPAYLLVYCL